MNFTSAGYCRPSFDVEASPLYTRDPRKSDFFYLWTFEVVELNKLWLYARVAKTRKNKPLQHLRMHSFTCDAAFWHTEDTDLNLIVTEQPNRPPSVSQHLEFISGVDKHKYSHIIPHKPPNTSYTPCCQRLGGLSPCLLWQDKRAWLWGGITFLPADCKNRYVTTQQLVDVWGKEEKIEIRFSTAPLPSSISVDISECFISCQNAVWKRATDTAVLCCGKQIWLCLMLSGLFEKFQTKHE